MHNNSAFGHVFSINHVLCPFQIPLSIIKGFEFATSVQFVYLGNDTIIKQLNVELQRDEFVLRSLTTKLLDQSVAEMFT